ncbi:MAG: hypothetical protein COX90_03205 [Candidatus Nealsonbacteria bacterium CG_4_10_14_0_2_um_filter_38_17]|uniref:Sugar transporter SemiSWEET n=1 Tax=Candidatus Nealsonbacteria bacterium CG_4_10_14_0_2_um_filter_38_17 TaxID=1974680 RepID=A0A2M7UXJ7_9BACT|nr:MAG: hypothetical protein COX90_03205 [Candidatus Nealsonbacteria bacterium CG_4_10_14_0_2_um_filter_38_17]
MIVDLIGYLGGFFIMVSFIPQVTQSFKTKSVEDLSSLMIISTAVGTIFWIVYGFLIKSFPIIIMNIIFEIFVFSQLYLKIKYKK